MSNAPAWLNGELTVEAALLLAVSDRGFTLGDGVFETIRARGSTLLWLDDHLARLRAGAELFGIASPLSDEAIARGLERLAEAGGHPESAIRLTLSRGPSDRRGLWPPGDPVKPVLLATIAPLPPPRPPLRLAVARSTRRNEFSPLSHVKSLNYGDNLLARRVADALGFDDALMLNTSGRIACATVANLFLEIDGRWRTPPLSEGALPGLARSRLLPLLQAEEAAITVADLDRAEAGLLSNSLGLATISTIETRLLQGDAEMPAALPVYP
jgi:branched-chain amino acid aminotransferase